MGKMQVASFLAMVAIMAQSTDALIHIVGGVMGWRVNPDKTYYCQWASHRTFGVGDQLVFPYSPASEDVYQISKDDFDHCTRNQVVNQWMMGPTVMPLNTPGDFYFMSSVGLHCEMGVKLHIHVGEQPGSDGINWNARVHPLHPLLTRKLLASSPSPALALAPAPSPGSEVHSS